MPESAGNGTPAVHLFPGALVAVRQLLHGHALRLKDHVLRIVQIPIAREDAAFALQPGKQRGARKRRQHRKARQIDPGADGKFHRGIKYVGRVVIQPEHEAALHRNAVPVQRANQLLEIDRAVELLARIAHAGGVDSFQPQQ